MTNRWLIFASVGMAAVTTGNDHGLPTLSGGLFIDMGDGFRFAAGKSWA
ncbi:MAG: hypothetical protein OXU69_00330 [Gemmatimonadota bacterium]|nr:hypothetical protein [Gemmatimonadota bacterium]MDE2983124.1 hypothetical protein [Gemmatimonadota bacterium]